MTNVTPIRRFASGKPQTMDLTGLLPNIRYQF